MSCWTSCTLCLCAQPSGISLAILNSMKALFWIGLVVLILGIVSLVVPIPRSEREGITVGGLSLGVEVQHDEKIHPGLSAVLILGGLGAMATGKRKSG